MGELFGEGPPFEGDFDVFDFEEFFSETVPFIEGFEGPFGERGGRFRFGGDGEDSSLCFRVGGETICIDGEPGQPGELEELPSLDELSDEQRQQLEQMMEFFEGLGFGDLFEEMFESVVPAIDLPETTGA